MIERLIAAVVLMAAGMIVYRLMIRRQIRQTTVLAATDPLLSGLKPGVPTILYFTTPTCIPCKTQQTPALQKLQGQLGEGIQIVRVDATEQPEAAQRWCVFSAPTTIVINGLGKTLAINHGVAEAAKLLAQLQLQATA